MKTIIGVLVGVLALPIAPHARAALILERIGAVSDARAYDFEDHVNGDRGVPMSCELHNGTVTLNLDDGTLDVVRQGTKKTIPIDRRRNIPRSTLACSERDRFFYAAPRIGRLYAYSADALFRGEKALLWQRSVTPFRTLDDAAGDMANASALAVVQTRHNLVLVEWFVRRDGAAEFRQRVFDASGAVLGTIGPSDLMAKTNESGPWWIFFQGGGADTLNYVPQNLLRLRVGTPTAGDKPAAVVLAELRASTKPARLDPVVRLPSNQIINHVISFLTPQRTATSTAVEFCPSVPPQRARYWLGDTYVPELAQLAQRMLLAHSAERQAAGEEGNPIDRWFQAEIAPKEPMKTLLQRFNPHDDAWVAQYQQALLGLGESTFNEWFDKYVRKDVEVVPDN